MNELDLNMKLLRGTGVKIDKLGTIYPVTIGDIENVTMNKYNQYLNVLCVDTEDIKRLLEITEDIQTFDFIYLNCIRSEEYKNIVIDALQFFFKEEVSLKENYGFYLGDFNDCRFINPDNYEEIKLILKKMNCLVSEVEEKEKYNPANEKARQIAEKLKKSKKIIKEIKRKESDGETLDLYDLISILVSYGNGIDIFNVWNLTFFQFNNQFNRMKIMKDYEVSIQILMNTTEPDKIKYQHWLSKIVKE